ATSPQTAQDTRHPQSACRAQGAGAYRKLELEVECRHCNAYGGHSCPPRLTSTLHSSQNLRSSKELLYNEPMNRRSTDRPIAIEPLVAGHWDAVRSIYSQGIATGNATFQQTAPDWEEWNAAHLRGCRLVARAEGQVVGWAALSPVSS